MAMKTLHCLCLLGLLLNVTGSNAGNPQVLVLATGSNSSIPTLTPPEARKLFLGVPLEKNGVHPVPLLNTSDPLTYEVFLQKIAFMSAATYENQTLTVVFRLGGKRPETFTDVDELVETLQENPGTVTYLWQEQVNAHQGIKIVNVLWQDAQN